MVKMDLHSKCVDIAYYFPDRKKKIMELARKLEPFIDSGAIESAKFWNGDSSAINVYSLARNREKVKKIT